MRSEEQVEFQNQVLTQMGRFERAAFRGPIVMELSADTTVQNPPYAHSIAKNILDLLSAPLPQLATGRRLLYRDDSQIHGLAVHCRHREERPRIGIIATPLDCFLRDLDLCAYAGRGADAGDGPDDPWEVNRAVEDLREWLRDEAVFRERIGHDEYEAILDLSRFMAQRAWLGDTRIRLAELAALYRRVNPRYPRQAHLWQDLNAQISAFFRRNSFRIHLDELPQRPGASEEYRRHVQEQIENYRARFGWILQPLRVPVALQVIVKPPPPGRAFGLNDLDNVARTYVIPQIVDAFAPPADLAWTINIARIRRQDPRRAEEWLARQNELPKTAQTGLTHFEVWRIPPDENPGFVSAAMVADIGDFWSPILGMDEKIESIRIHEEEKARDEFRW